MGYKPTTSSYELVFEDMPGLTVTARGGSMAELIEMESLKVSINESDPRKKLAVFEFLSSRIITWDMEHPDTKKVEDEWQPCARCGLLPDAPLPSNVEHMMCLELSTIMSVFFGWIFAVARLSLPKGMNLSDGGPNIQEELMSQLAKLQNPGTSPTPN